MPDTTQLSESGNCCSCGRQMPCNCLRGMLKNQEIALVVQINGKKRGLIVTKKDLSEKDALIEAKKIENIRKNLKDKKIVKNIFVKNKIINFITA